MPDVKKLISLWEGRSGGNSPASAPAPASPLVDPLTDGLADEKSSAPPSVAAPSSVSEAPSNLGYTLDEKAAYAAKGVDTHEGIVAAKQADDEKVAFLSSASSEKADTPETTEKG